MFKCKACQNFCSATINPSQSIHWHLVSHDTNLRMVYDLFSASRAAVGLNMGQLDMHYVQAMSKTLEVKISLT